ncbi:PLP-dependent aminotransferase family protein [Thiomonas intermedia]|uniref:aminotransferase-like domain-containing protein n=1 Tax=Thiomonas intermedia TaxID=926 RepID=UPI0009A47499|nr:PLP-dependent aminotransferase family protein [Thiomonas intermedia]
MANLTDTVFASSEAATLQRHAAATLAEQLAAQFAARIRNRLLPPGSRLPSVRDCARRYGLSTQTVVAAYDRLQALGLVEARAQRGYFVRATEEALAPSIARRGAAQTEVAAPMMPPTHATALVRGMFHQMGAGAAVALRGAPGSGVLPAPWLESPALGSALRRIARANELEQASLHYGHPQGDLALREALSRQLAGLSLQAPPQQILTTNGASQALDLVLRALTRPGDAVLVESPGWAMQFAQMAHHGLKLLPVPRGADGPDLDILDQLARAHAPRLFICVSVLHNPTGQSLSAASAHRVLQLAQRYGFQVVEDDVYAALAETSSPRMSVLDQLEHTIYLSGFSKILAPGWRVGFVAAAPGIIDRLIDQKLLAVLTTPTLSERALAHVLGQGQLRRTTQQVRDRLDAARARAVRWAEKAGCRFVTPPRGLLGWVDTGVDTATLAQRLLDAGYLLAPGHLFDPQQQPSTRMRINFTQTQDEAFWRAYAAARG